MIFLDGRPALAEAAMPEEALPADLGPAETEQAAKVPQRRRTA
jgi:hypothetical protein